MKEAIRLNDMGEISLEHKGKQRTSKKKIKSMAKMTTAEKMKYWHMKNNLMAREICGGRAVSTN